MIPILGSLAAHCVFFVWLFAAPLPKNPSTYNQLIKPQETHLVWYNFKTKLPDVSPAKSAERKPLRAEVLEKQAIVSSPKDAPKAPQMIFHPAPEIRPQPPTPLPNLIALSAPPPPQRLFVPPKPVEQAKPAAQIAEPAPAPRIEAHLRAPDLPKLPDVAKPFTAPPEHRAKLELKVVTTPDAPELKPDAAKMTASAERALTQGSRTLAFRPQPKRSITASVGAMPDAPAMDGASKSNANIAVVGLNPIDKLNVPLPVGSRRAQFAAGPKLNPDGATASGKSSGLSVPDLTVRGGDRQAAADLLARSMSPSFDSPTSMANLNTVAREVAPHAHGKSDEAGHGETGRDSGMPVSGAPDPRFLGRQVFSVAIQSPNLTSHTGSWLMWYADRSPSMFRQEISAPEPLHKVDPKYIATAAEERIEGVVRLVFVISEDGRVYGVETVKSLDKRLDQSAVEAIRKWEFAPATRNGKPVEVDALVEIPFRLAPPEPK